MQPKDNFDVDAKIRHVRVEHRESTQILAEDNQGWAVSYSDMLMVLMSFFVIFFSFENEEKDSLFTKITLEMGARAGVSTGGGTAISGSGSSATLPAGSLEGGISQIADDLSDSISLQVSVASAEEMTIHLSDNIYASRQFAVNAALRRELDIILDILEPNKAQLRIAFIGHSDTAQISNPQKLLANNFDLSSLRASRAMSYAVAQGYDPKHLAIEASASNLRDTRSLSVRVSPIKTAK